MPPSPTLVVCEALGAELGEHFLALRELSSTNREPLRPVSHLPSVLDFCVWASRKKKALGLAPCLSGIQHFQGACLVSSSALAFPHCSPALARVSWLWVRLNAQVCAAFAAALSLLGRQSQASLPARPMLQGQQRPFMRLSWSVEGRYPYVPPPPCVLPSHQHSPG